jgi:hypothetical protein
MRFGASNLQSKAMNQGSKPRVLSSLVLAERLLN